VKEKDIQEYRIDPGNSDEGRNQPKPLLLTLAFDAARLASRIATIRFRMRARQLAPAGQATALADGSEILAHVLLRFLHFNGRQSYIISGL
jgi:hypothetical protein